MTWRQWLKFLAFSYCPGLRGRFRYFGIRVFFPPGSLVFRAACADGIYEQDNERLIASLVRPGTHFFDVGSNIGLMAIPVLKWIPDSRAISFEPSPTVLPCLRRTIAESAFRERWELVEKAVGEVSGRANFALTSGAESAYESLQSTGRARSTGRVEVALTTLDDEWGRLGRPTVSLIKIDVEGAELGVLRGASGILRDQRPPVILEWNATNLAAFGIEPGSLLDTAAGLGYRIYSIPNLVRIDTPAELRAHMVFSESFLLHAA